MDDYLQRLRHTTAHILAMAVLRLWPDTKLGIGPVIEDGFYYDFEFAVPITHEDLEKIEDEMKKIIEEDLPVRQIFMDKKEAMKFYRKWDQPYKRELLKEIDDEKVSFYVIGDEEKGFVDLCKGPHLTRTGEVVAFKLLSIAGAYWRGDEKNPMLTRIYGTAFMSQEELEEFLKQREESKKRDHRVLNKRLKYYFIDPDIIGSGIAVFLPRGAYVREQLEHWIVEKYKALGHHLVYTPHIAKDKLWYTSGHLPYYEENMFPKMKVNDEEVYYLKAMNCPLHIQIYKQMVQSYRDLPFRVTDMATVYRYEKAGELHGLTRVRALTQDDGHIFLAEEMIEEELVRLLELAFDVYKTFEFKDLTVDVSLRSNDKKDKYLGDDSVWEKAEEMLINAVRQSGVSYNLMEGEAAFYGPKLDFHLKDSLGRRWQVATIQLDFNLPQRFNLTYTDKDGSKKTPVMIHRAIFGTFHRFMALLIEHFAGNLPLWLEYEKVRIIPVSEKHSQYAFQVKEVLESEGIRLVTVDDKDEPLANRIRRAEEEKIPYVVVVGDKEVNTSTVAVRVRSHGDVGLYNIEEFIGRLKEEILRKMNRSIFLQ